MGSPNNFSASGKNLFYQKTSDAVGPVVLVYFDSVAFQNNVSQFAGVVDILAILRELCHAGQLTCNMYIKNYSYIFPIGQGSGNMNFSAKPLPVPRKGVTRNLSKEIQYQVYH